MALTFPANPTVGQTYISSDYTYAWDGVKWTSVKRQILCEKLLKGSTELKSGPPYMGQLPETTWCRYPEDKEK